MAFHGLLAHFFLVMNDIPLSDVPEFIHSLTKGHLGCFCSFIVMNKGAVNVMKVFVWT